MKYIKSWTENIIIVVIISIIIEMILPNSSSKKYVKVVSGLYLLYVIINPILNINVDSKLNEFENLLVANETVQTSSNSGIAESYISSLQISIKSQIEAIGYQVQNLEIEANSDYSDIEKIEVDMKSTNFDENKIREIILANFEIDSQKIDIK